MTERLSRFQNTSVINCPPWLGGNWEQERWRGAAIVLKLARGYMRRIRTFSAAAAQMIAGAAQADLARVGPNSPAPPAVPTTASSNGFPLWYQDSPGGMVLDLCLPDPNDRGTFAALNQGNDAQALACFVPFNPPPGGRIFGVGTFPDEMFYFNGGALMTVPGGAKARLVLALESAFGGGAVQAGQQMVFNLRDAHRRAVHRRNEAAPPLAGRVQLSSQRLVILRSRQASFPQPAARRYLGGGPFSFRHGSIHRPGQTQRALGTASGRCSARRCCPVVACGGGRSQVAAPVDISRKLSSTVTPPSVWRMLRRPWWARAIRSASINPRPM